MATAIQTRALTRRFGNMLAVDHLNLDIEQGQVFGFLGPNGAGKTTTVRLLNGVLAASEGEARVLGYDVRTEANEIRRHTGVLTETPNLYDPLSGRDNLLFFGELYNVPAERLPGRVDALLDAFGLLNRANDAVEGYSKGMRQRLAILRALLHEPPIVFLDEPTASLDPVAARMVTDMIRNLSHREGRTVFLCTHNLTEAQRLCDRVGVIDHGVLQAVGTPRELANQLWQRLTVEIDLLEPTSPAVAEALARIPAVKAQNADSDVLVIELESKEAIPDVVSAIAAVGGRIYRVTPREHTLEDIYFQIQDGNGASAEREAQR